MRALHFGAIAVIFTACNAEHQQALRNDPADPADIVTGTKGSRLVPQYVRSLDGTSRRFLQLLDTELGQPCRLNPLNGETKASCHPRAFGTVVFLDAACTTPYVATDQGEEPVVVAVGFPPLAGAVKVGQRVRSDAQVRYMGGGTQRCFESGVLPSTPIYEITEFLPDEALAAGVIETLVLSDDLEVDVFNGDDGSSVIYELIDRNVGTTCTPQLLASGGRCVVEIGEVSDEGLLDASCEDLVVLDYTVDPVARVPERNNEIYRFATEGYEAPVKIGRREANGQCVVEEEHPGRKTLFTGHLYPEEQWPVIEIRNFGGLLWTQLPVLPNGQSAEAERHLDSAALFSIENVRCGPVWIDGVLRCAPSAPEGWVSWAKIFADARCSQPAIALRDEEGPPQVFTSIEGVAGGEDGYLPIGRIFQVSHEMRRGEAYEAAGGTCRPSTIDARFFALGAPVEAGNYPELRLTIE